MIGWMKQWAGGRVQRLLWPACVVGGALWSTLPAAQSVAQGVDPRGNAATSGNPAMTRLDSRLTELEGDLRAATGRIEELSFQVRQLEKKLEKMDSDLDYRLNQAKAANEAPPGPRALGSQTPVPSSATPPSSAAASAAGAVPQLPATPPVAAATTQPSTTASATSAPSAQGPKEQYARAFSQLQQANYDAAASGFSEFVRQYPNDSLVDNARYWLGETYYARGDYPRAAETFLDGYEKNKTSPKAPDTLLKLGMALGSLNKKTEACATFKELNRAFPDAAAAIKDKAAQESRRYACP